MILDMHTHKEAPQPLAIINIRVKGDGNIPVLDPSQAYSVGIHPWDLPEMNQEQIDAAIKEVETLAALPNVLAVGECGVDTLRGGAMFRQLNTFKAQIQISEQTSKPMIIHNVKADDIVCALRRDLKPRQPWCLHGYRGKPAAALQLIKAGCFLSFNNQFNPQTLQTIPTDRILAETDEAPLSIEEIIRLLSEARSEDLSNIIATNSALFCNFGV